MAFAVRIEAYRYPCTSPMLRVEPQWWDTNELKDDSRFKCEEIDRGYDDYIARLIPAEFKELHQRYRPHAFWPSSTEDNHYPALLLLDGIVEYLSEDIHHFVVTVFEWWSGYGD